MSLYYRHLLIPISPEYCPNLGTLTKFVRGVIANGNVPSDASIQFAKVTKGEGKSRMMQARNPKTGEVTNFQGPSRRAERPQQLTDVSQVIELAAQQPEFDVSLVSEGVPPNPPLDLGYIEQGTWKRMEGRYHREIRCHVRANVVRLYSRENNEEPKRPIDRATRLANFRTMLANLRPRFDEDCSASERDGLCEHPTLGKITVENAGCGRFWIEFNYGKWLFPRSSEQDGINVLAQSVVHLARTTFETEVVQACSWG